LKTDLWIPQKGVSYSVSCRKPFFGINKKNNNLKSKIMATKFIPCDERCQIYSFQRTTKKARQVDLNVNDKYKPNTFKKLKNEK
jgi:hypothetical protein